MEPGIGTSVYLEQASRATRSGSPWAERIATAAFMALASALLYITARPLFTDDTWWHLTLGREFATSGPWLEASPSLHTSIAPPAPAAWLSDLLLYGASLPFGLVGLRILHVLVVAAVLAGVWLALRRASNSAGVAGLGAAFFLVFSAYRLVQLRPELATMLATVALYLGFLQRREVPSWRRVAFAVLLCGVWANLHPAFPLGPILIASACMGLLLELAMTRDAPEPGLKSRVWRLGWATLLGTGASLLNPMGVQAHLLYFGAGRDAPAMNFVADEWAPLTPFRLPLAHLPPGALGWIGYWALVIATISVIAIGLRRWRGKGERAGVQDPDGALVALALLGLLAPLIAVRFLWLSLFPLLLLAHAARETVGVRAKASWLVASLSVLLIPAFHQFGEWRLLSGGVSRATYFDAYDRSKYYGHAVRFLKESGLEGNLYNSYFMGGFLGYWLAPRLRVFIDGSLDVPPRVMTDYLALQANDSGSRNSDVGALLDHYQVDVYLGIGFPAPPLANRPWRHTTRHLEGNPDWMLVFRNMESAVYLRRNERNRENLERVEAYYARAGVGFDPEAGIDVAHIVDEDPEWASSHGLVPRRFEQLMSDSGSYGVQNSITNVISSAYLALGLEERALETDAALIRRIPTASSPRRRRIGALLRLGRIDEALIEAEELDQLQPGDGLSRALIDAARQCDEVDSNECLNRLPRLSVLTQGEALLLGALQIPAAPLSDRIETNIVPEGG